MTAQDTTPSPANRYGGSIIWRRRRAAMVRTWRQLWSEPQGRWGVVLLGLAVVVAVVAPLAIDSSATSAIHAPGQSMEGPSTRFLLGTDEFGRSVLSLLLLGARSSLVVGFAAGAIAMVIGTLLGTVSGHFGSWIDSVIMRFDDWMLAIPFLPLVIVLTTLLGRSTLVLIVVLGITSWPGITRVLRAQVLSIKQRPYMERAKALGAGHFHRMIKHELPNMMPLVLANTTLTIASVILSQSALAFLGLGDPNDVSWGSMLDGAFQDGAVNNGQWGYLLAPGIAIVLVVLAFTLCGNALEKVLNPRLAVR